MAASPLYNIGNGGAGVNVNKILKIVAIVCTLLIIGSVITIQAVKSSERKAFEKEVHEMLNSDDPEKIINGVIASEVKLEKLKVDYVAATAKDAVIEVSYAEPYSDEEMLTLFSIFSVDLTQRIVQYGKTDSIRYNFSCPFIDNKTGETYMHIAMSCTLDKAQVKDIDIEGFNALLNRNCLQLRQVTDVIVSPGIERNLQ